ncbi:MAG: hypothetical protein IKN85_13575 [Oscillospiraceae bacterium]|nr:hypothetical protein [Oscillospiraceae bacterium]MBR6834469.1 hypothetical protein [Oscillospiraceae bacterium]
MPIVPKKIIKKVAKKTFKYAYKSTKNDIQNATKAIKSGVNSNYRQSSGTTDTGAKSVDLVKKTGKTTVKTVKTTVKTTKKTIRTVKNLPKNVKRTVKTAVKIAKATVKVAKATVKVVAKIIAWLSDPLVAAIVLGVIVLAWFAYQCVILFQGAAAAEGQTKQAYSQAAGLGNVPAEFQDGLKILQECKKKMKEDGYDKWIDGFKYDPNNLKEADMIYMIRYDKDGNQKVFDTGIVSDPQKQALKNALEWNCGIDDVEILAIAYVLEQKDKNEITPEKEYKINQVKYTDTLINRILTHVVEWHSDHVDKNQPCKDRNCIKIEHVDEVDNPNWAAENVYVTNLTNAINAYQEVVNKLGEYEAMSSNDPGRASTWNYIVGLVADWKSNYAKDPKWGITYTPYYSSKSRAETFIEDPLKINLKICTEERDQYPQKDQKTSYEYKCDSLHDLYSNRLQFYNKESIMNALNFNDVDKLWEDLTENYLRTVQTPAVTS